MRVSLFEMNCDFLPLRTHSYLVLNVCMVTISVYMKEVWRAGSYSKGGYVSSSHSVSFKNYTTTKVRLDDIFPIKTRNTPSIVATVKTDKVVQDITNRRKGLSISRSDYLNCSLSRKPVRVCSIVVGWNILSEVNGPFPLMKMRHDRVPSPR